MNSNLNLDDDKKNTIISDRNKVIRGYGYGYSRILTFKTEEIRDNFFREI